MIKEYNKMQYKMEYHEGYYAAGNGIAFDETKSKAWQEGYDDGIAAIYDMKRECKDRNTISLKACEQCEYKYCSKAVGAFNKIINGDN